MTNPWLRAIVAALLPVVLCVACWAADDQPPAGGACRLMAESAAKYFASGYKDITADELWAELNDGDPTQPYVISVRSLADDTARGYIPGAHHWDPADLIRHRDELPRDKKIVIYCYTGQSSAACTAYLNLVGFDAYNLRWGLCSWTADTAQIGQGGGWYTPGIGHQTLETQPRPMTADYRLPQPKAGGHDEVDLFCANIEPQVSKPAAQWAVKSAADVYANMEDADAANDWFVAFCGPEAVYEKGHIPGAHWLDPARLGDEATLQHLPTDKPIVVYCLNGHLSMQVVTVLNALGYEAYSLTRGLSAISDDESLLGSVKWMPGTQNRPLAKGALPIR
jgi:rhodanese-related sulfurtransferase